MISQAHICRSTTYKPWKDFEDDPYAAHQAWGKVWVMVWDRVYNRFWDEVAAQVAEDLEKRKK